MPEITPDLSDPHRCVAVHWVLPVQCVLPSSHREDHEAWHPQTGNRIKFCGESVAPSTHELHDGEWHALDLPKPGAKVCGEPSTWPGVTCQQEHGPDGNRWNHFAVVDGCRYTWNTPHARPVTSGQLDQEVRSLRAEVEQLLTELGGRDEAARERWIERQIAETGLRSMDFRNGMSMDIEPARDMVAQWVGAARAMLGDAPNYSETPIEMVVKVGESPERFAFTLQRVGKLTPHEARQKAEARVAELEQQLTAAQARVAELEQSAAPTVAQQPGDGCSCMPHRKFDCGHCEMDVCEDCGRCCSCTCAAEGGERP